MSVSSEYSNIASATTPAPTLAAPSTLVATAVSSSQINLTWADNSAGETNFSLERSLDGTSWSAIASPAADSTAYSDTGLAESTLYYYRTKAVGPPDSNYSNTASATTDASASLDDFTSTWRTTLGFETVTLPLRSTGTYNMTVDWGDGSSDVITAWNQAEATHTYDVAGDHLVTISGTCSSFHFNNAGDRAKIISVGQWGTVGWNTFESAFYGCSNLLSVGAGDTSGATNFDNAFRNCVNLATVGSMDTSSATRMVRAFQACNSLTSLALLDTSNVLDFTRTWRECGSLTSFPAIDTSSATTFELTWEACTSLTSFPVIDVHGVDLLETWRDCTGLTSFPVLSGTATTVSFRNAWTNCSSLTSFPLLDTSSGADFLGAWGGCSSLTSFPLIDTSSATNVTSAWFGCSSLTSFPLLDLGSVTAGNSSAWANCSGLTSFPLIDTSSWTSVSNAWNGCFGLTSFPLLDTSSVTNFAAAWFGCTGLTNFPLLDFDSGADFTNAWGGFTMDTANYDAILVDLEANNPNNGVALGAGSSTYSDAPAAAGVARASLASRSWVITDGGPV